MPHSMEMITVDGATVRLLRGGSGTPVVFLHGAGGHTGWMGFLEELSQRFAVFAPEHPGFGQSDDPPWLDNVADLAYFYLDLLKALDLERVHLIGTSLGGWIAAEMAVRDTARLASLTLVGAVGISAGGETIPDIFRMPVEENLRRFYADRPRFHNPDLGKWLHRVDVPTLLLWGAADGLVPPKFGETYRALIPGSRLVVLPAAGHAPFDEQREAFLAAFHDFIGGAESAGAGEGV